MKIMLQKEYVRIYTCVVMHAVTSFLIAEATWNMFNYTFVVIYTDKFGNRCMYLRIYPTINFKIYRNHDTFYATWSTH